MSLHVKKGDTVLILAGKDKGKTGKILSADPKGGRVVVDGCNVITKHVKPRGANQPGGINKMPGPIDASNVQIICPSCDKAVRAAHKEVDGKNVRVCIKCGASLEPKVKADKKAKKSKSDKAEKTETVVEETVAEETTAKKPVKKTAKKADSDASPVAEKKTAAKKAPAKKASAEPDAAVKKSAQDDTDATKDTVEENTDALK